MYRFSKQSEKELATLHPDLHFIMRLAIRYVDFTIIKGHRGEKEQNKAFNNGFSKVEFPNSKHNTLPSKAVDIAPYPIEWEDITRFYYLAGIIVGIAKQLKECGKIEHDIRYGGDWDMDGEIKDNKFNDLGHFELI